MDRPVCCDRACKSAATRPSSWTGSTRVLTTACSCQCPLSTGCAYRRWKRCTALRARPPARACRPPPPAHYPLSDPNRRPTLRVSLAELDQLTPALQLVLPKGFSFPSAQAPADAAWLHALGDKLAVRVPDSTFGDSPARRGAAASPARCRADPRPHRRHRQHPARTAGGQRPSPAGPELEYHQYAQFGCSTVLWVLWRPICLFLSRPLRRRAPSRPVVPRGVTA